MALAGWRVAGELPDAPKFVVIVVPHTSNWDFLVCIMSMFAVGLQLTWLGKHSLFRFPVSPILRWLGGEPVNRSATQGTVEIAIERFQERSQWVLGISPEGTRGPVQEWKSGFHRIAVGAAVPILPISLEYNNRVLRLGTLFHPTADRDADVAALQRLFRREMALHSSNYIEPG